MTVSPYTLHHPGEPQSQPGADIVANDIAECTNDQNRPDEFCPAARDCHGGSGCRTADVGVARQDDLLATEFEEFPEREGNKHVDEDDESRKKQNQSSVLTEQRNR